MTAPVRWVGTDSAADARVRAGLLRSFLLALIAVECWERSARLEGLPGFSLAVGLALAATAAAALVWRAGFEIAATGLAFAVVATDFASQFPESPNHQYLQLVLLALLLLLREQQEAEVEWLTVCLRWLLVLAVFHAGLQKLLWGQYFDGTFLGYAVSQSERFAAVLGWAMPAAELERLTSLQVQEGAGPFAPASPLFVIASNLAFLAEFALPVALLVPATRKLAVLGTLAYFVAIESAAREVFFGGKMAALVLCFAPASWMRVARPIGFAGLAVLLATTFGLVPRWFFS